MRATAATVVLCIRKGDGEVLFGEDERLKAEAGGWLHTVECFDKLSDCGMYVCVYVCMCVYVYLRACVCVYVYVCACVVRV